MPIPNHADAIAYAIRRLRQELPAELTYHNLYHTVEDVLPAVERLATLCGLNGEDRHLLQVAAAYHDIGFIETYNGHEMAGARIMAQTLPGFGYSAEQIDRLVKLVLATRLPQSPANLPEEILVDSDLDVLGREDFFKRSEDLRLELSRRGEPIAHRSWYKQQLGFLQGHTYFTPEAHELRAAGKQSNIALLEEKIQNGPE